MSSYSKFKKAMGVNLPEPVNNYFTEHNQNGYQSKNGLITYTEYLTEIQYKQVEEMFDFIRQRFKITNRIEAKEDLKTRDFIIWISFDMPNGKRTLPIAYDEGILRFLTEYQQVGLRFEVDFEELLSEAGVKFNVSGS